VLGPNDALFSLFNYDTVSINLLFSLNIPISSVLPSLRGPYYLSRRPADYQNIDDCPLEFVHTVAYRALARFQTSPLLVR
jgi:hypothetical protein